NKRMDTNVASLSSLTSIFIYLPTVHAYRDEPDKVNTFFDYCIMILIPVLLVDLSQQKEYNGNIAVAEQVLTGISGLALLIYMSVKSQNPFIDAVPVIATIVAAVLWLFAIIYIIRRKRKHYKRYYEMLPQTRFWWLHFDGFINDRKIPVIMSLSYAVPVYMHVICKDSFISIWASNGLWTRWMPS
ncbi:15009_t:CDS:2, partial [Funneliformis caledonium]